MTIESDSNAEPSDWGSYHCFNKMMICTEFYFLWCSTTIAQGLEFSSTHILWEWAVTYEYTSTVFVSMWRWSLLSLSSMFYFFVNAMSCVLYWCYLSWCQDLVLVVVLFWHWAEKCSSQIISVIKSSLSFVWFSATLLSLTP